MLFVCLFVCLLLLFFFFFLDLHVEDGMSDNNNILPSNASDLAGFQLVDAPDRVQSVFVKFARVKIHIINLQSPIES